MYFRLLRSVLACTWAGRSFFRSKSRISAADVVGQAGDPERLERTHRPPALGQRRPDAVRTITQGCHQAQTGYDHAAFGTKHVMTRRSSPEQVSNRLSRPELFTRVEPPPYYCLRTAIVAAQTRRRAQIFRDRPGHPLSPIGGSARFRRRGGSSDRLRLVGLSVRLRRRFGDGFDLASRARCCALARSRTPSSCWVNTKFLGPKIWLARELSRWAKTISASASSSPFEERLGVDDRPFAPQVGQGHLVDELVAGAGHAEEFRAGDLGQDHLLGEAARLADQDTAGLGQALDDQRGRHHRDIPGSDRADALRPG